MALDRDLANERLQAASAIAAEEQAAAASVVGVRAKMASELRQIHVSAEDAFMENLLHQAAALIGKIPEQVAVTKDGADISAAIWALYYAKLAKFDKDRTQAALDEIRKSVLARQLNQQEGAINNFLNTVLSDETASEEAKRAAVEMAEKVKLQLRQDGALAASALVEQNIQKAAQLVWMSSL